MDAPIKKSSFPWPALLVGSCVVLVLLACGFSAVLGTGGILLTTQLAKARSSSAQPGLVARSEPAVLQEIRGKVEVMGTSGAWAPAAENQSISAGQRVRAGGLSSARLVFNDGSRALLHADSELVVEALEAAGEGQQRVIRLNQVSGQSDHEVAPSKHKGSRYEVNTPSGAGEAKGTQFQVVVTEEQTAYFYVLEGTVAVTGKKDTVLVGAGQMTIIALHMPPLTPINSVVVEGVVTQVGDVWIVGGQSFAVSDTTILSGDPKVGDWVLVKGHLLGDETKAADWIRRIYTPPVNQFRLTGKVETIGDAEWKVNGQSIAITADTEIDTSIAVGHTVLVQGIVLAEGKLQAVSIRRVDEERGLPFDFTGVIQKISAAAWTISGIPVTINDETLLDTGLQEGEMVRARGYIDQNSAWIAESIWRVENAARTFQFTGTIDSMEPWKVSGIAFETREWTEIDEGLKTGDRVLVEGIIDENGVWIAARVEKLESLLSGRIILVGVVFGIDPWVIGGIPVKVDGTTVIIGDIKVGMLVRVELVLQADGTWLAVNIRPLSLVFWFPGCFEILATVVSVDGDRIQLLNWPLLFLDDTVKITGKDGENAGDIGVLVPGSVVRLLICFDDHMVIRVIYIIIIEPPIDDDDGPQPDTGKVTVCHKPGKKKGGHSLTISRSALPAHLGHGDYVGACR